MATFKVEVVFILTEDEDTLDLDQVWAEVDMVMVWAEVEVGDQDQNIMDHLKNIIMVHHHHIITKVLIHHISVTIMVMTTVTT